jgi:hypothetical protein
MLAVLTRRVRYYRCRKVDACLQDSRAGPFAPWVWVLDAPLCSAVAGRWTRIPRREKMPNCASAVTSRRARKCRQRNGGRSVSEAASEGAQYPSSSRRGSIWSRVQGGGRNRWRFPGWQGLAAAALGGALRMGVGPCHLWGSCTQQRVHSAKYPTRHPPGPSACSSFGAWEFREGTPLPASYFFPSSALAPDPQSSCWPSARPTTSTATLSPLKPATRRPASALSWTSTSALPTDLPSLLTAYR